MELGLTLASTSEGSGLKSKSKHLPLGKSVLIIGVTELLKQVCCYLTFSYLAVKKQ